MLPALAWLTCCAAGPAPATDARETPCAGASSQREAEACWSAAARSSEAAVDAALAQATASMRAASAQDADRLREAHDTWLRYRDSHCALYALRLAGGSAAPTARAVCRWRLAGEREAELRRLDQAWRPGR